MAHSAMSRFCFWSSCVTYLANAISQPEIVTEMGHRKSSEESCKVLQSLTILGPGEMPPLPTRPPRHDDEHVGLR
jgi:hypothetical protein